MTNQIQQPLNISKQILIFMVVVLGMTILLGIVSVLLKTSMIGVSIIVPMVAAMISGQSFVKAHNRAPTKDEAKRLAAVSFFFFIGLQFLFLTLALANPALKDVFAQFNSKVLAILAFFLVFYFGIAFVLIRWGYGGMTQKFANKQN